MSKISNFCPIKALKNKPLLACLLSLVVFICVSTTYAYQLGNTKWPQPTTTFYVDIPGQNGLWNDSFEGAMYEWNVATIFQFYIVPGTYSDPCDPDDDRNGVSFSSTLCGDDWGAATLAVCTIWTVGSTISETDIVFNSNESWNVYSTSWKYSVNDFRRVAVHELGHALGLYHEDSGPVSIMRTYAGDITIPQQDDINGVAALYGGSATYYRDHDGDGYGNPNNSTESTTQPSGYVTDHTDCNDYNASIHPVAYEIRGDGIDQDCDGFDDEMLFSEASQRLVTEIFVATFERAPAYGGLMYWVDAIETSLFTIDQVTQSFFDQPETKDKFPEGSSNSQFITTIFQNTLSRTPTAEGLAYWVGALDQGALRRDQAIMAVINGAKAATGDPADAAMLTKKTEIGILFANSGLGTSTNNENFMDWAKNIIRLATSSDFHMEEAEEYIAQLLSENADN
ncbi:DUF4214 domain-containing protein [Desulfobacula toluolica]|uniref:Putative peptidase, M12A family n=1 Tax=Desulfobacula toluolica (strain DSM 7467 / Tol2) TaxID=651182 RepID=K0NFB9_DESTT|nr:DUF4214 domain-containing protein [Desulfobacula toluolica]CCK79590.1 putative peptidase, M12A family [Desulfobacula toluolica Tol2]